VSLPLDPKRAQLDGVIDPAVSEMKRVATVWTRADYSSQPPSQNTMTLEVQTILIAAQKVKAQ
jgi:hypothetical protein